MSHEAVREFWIRVAGDQSLQTRIGLIDAAGREEALTALVAIGAEHGLAFTAAELADNIAGGRQLDDQELDAAVGGLQVPGIGGISLWPDEPDPSQPRA